MKNNLRTLSSAVVAAALLYGGSAWAHDTAATLASQVASAATRLQGGIDTVSAPSAESNQACVNLGHDISSQTEGECLAVTDPAAQAQCFADGAQNQADAVANCQALSATCRADNQANALNDLNNYDLTTLVDDVTACGATADDQHATCSPQPDCHAEGNAAFDACVERAHDRVSNFVTLTVANFFQGNENCDGDATVASRQRCTQTPRGVMGKLELHLGPSPVVDNPAADVDLTPGVTDRDSDFVKVDDASCVRGIWRINSDRFVTAFVTDEIFRQLAALSAALAAEIARATDAEAGIAAALSSFMDAQNSNNDLQQAEINATNSALADESSARRDGDAANAAATAAVSGRVTAVEGDIASGFGVPHNHVLMSGSHPADSGIVITSTFSAVSGGDLITHSGNSVDDLSARLGAETARAMAAEANLSGRVDRAQGTGDAALGAAASAQGTANAALGAAAGAQNTANSALGLASAANSTAVAALGAAANAQNTANDARNRADTAQSTANLGVSVGSLALSYLQNQIGVNCGGGAHVQGFNGANQPICSADQGGSANHHTALYSRHKPCGTGGGGEVTDNGPETCTAPCNCHFCTHFCTHFCCSWWGCGSCGGSCGGTCCDQCPFSNNFVGFTVP